VNEGNIREVRKRVRRAANEEMAPFFIEHLKEWRDLSKGADDIEGINKLQIMETVGTNVDLIVGFIQNWLLPEAKERLLVAIFQYEEENNEETIDPRSVLAAYSTFFESRKFDDPDIETKRKETVENVEALAKGIKDWNPLTRRGWELADGHVVFPQKFVSGHVPHNVLLVKNVPLGVREARRWMERQQEFVFRAKEDIDVTSGRKVPLGVTCTIRLPEMVVACLSGQKQSRSVRIRSKEEKFTEEMAREWEDREPDFRSLSLNDILKEMLEFIENNKDISFSDETYPLRRIPIRFKKTILTLWLDQPRGMVNRCIDSMEKMKIIASSHNGNLFLTALGKELCRLEVPNWMTTFVRRQSHRTVDSK